MNLRQQISHGVKNDIVFKDLKVSEMLFQITVAKYFTD